MDSARHHYEVLLQFHGFLMGLPPGIGVGLEFKVIDKVDDFLYDAFRDGGLEWCCIAPASPFFELVDLADLLAAIPEGS